MIPIFSSTRQQFANHILESLGRGFQLGQRLYSEWFQEGRILASHPAYTNASEFLLEFFNAVSFKLPLTPKAANKGESAFKFLSKTIEGYEVESVFLPMKSGGTLCISSQVGCAMGCAFCETGKMGLLRSLSSEEIVAQVFIARFVHKLDFRNLVFMGMGEPLDNFDAVTQAIHILTDFGGLNFPEKRITVSTCGRVDEILKMAEASYPRVHLAVSINSPTDAVRNKLMPINKRFNMEALKKAMNLYCEKTKRQILAEYVLIKDWTDSDQDAQNLREYLKGLDIKLNLIPLNPGRRSRFEAPDTARIEAFARLMKEEGLPVFIRHNKGRKIMAACGQLGNSKSRAAFRRRARQSLF